MISAPNGITCSKCDRETYICFDVAVSVLHSLLRAAATLAIFIFHIKGLYGYDNKHMVDCAFSAFMYLSGFYCVIKDQSPGEWLTSRLKRIYLPYWFVCSAVIAADAVTQYKELTFAKVVVLLAGGNFFLEDNLYTVAWFVTVVVLYYAAVFLLYSFREAVYWAVLIFVIIYLYYRIGIHLSFSFFFFFGFIFHFLLKNSKLLLLKFPMKGVKLQVVMNVRVLLRYVDSISYEFYLTHGIVLLCFCRVLKLNYITCLYLSFATSLLSAFFLKQAVRFFFTNRFSLP